MNRHLVYHQFDECGNDAQARMTHTALDRSNFDGTLKKTKKKNYQNKQNNRISNVLRFSSRCHIHHTYITNNEMKIYVCDCQTAKSNISKTILRWKIVLNGQTKIFQI